MLADLLHERGLGQTQFAESIGVKFHNIHRWIRGFEFTRFNQRLAARGLLLPDDHFGPQDSGPRPSTRSDGVAHRLQMERHERDTREAFGRFLRESAVAASLAPADIAVLRSIRFTDDGLRPTKAFYEAVSFALKGAIRREEILPVAALNAALDATLARKRPVSRR
jgi:hypothetical protein